MTPNIHSTSIAVAVLVIIAAGIMIVMVTGSRETDQSIQSDASVKATLPGLVTTPRSSALNASGEAVSRIRGKNPDPDHTLTNSTATDSSQKKA